MRPKWACSARASAVAWRTNRGSAWSCGAVVVHDDVHVEIDRHVALDLIEKLAELRCAVATHALAHDGSGLDVESGKERGRSVPRVVVCPALSLSGAHRQQRLCAVERLNLALLIDAEHDGPFGRRQIEPNDVAHFLDEQRIGRELECLDPVPLQPEGTPD